MHSKSWQVYLAQTVLKLLFVSLVVTYTIPLLNSFSFAHNCEPEAQAMVGFSAFECVHVLSSLTHKLLVAYLVLLVLYGLLNLYTLTWILHRSARSHTRLYFWGCELYFGVSNVLQLQIENSYAIYCDKWNSSLK